MSRPALSYFDFVRQFCTSLTPQGQVVPMELYPTERRFAEALFAIDPETRLRRIRRALYSAPKKTGKTGFVASIVAHHFFFGDEVNREIPLIAFDLDQTAYLFDAIKGLIGRHRQLTDWIDGNVGKREITFADELGVHVIRRLARDEFGSHGGNPSLVVADEAWTLPDWSMLSALSFSPLRVNPLILFASYAGFESDMRPGRPLYDWWLKLQPGAPPDPSFHGVWMTGAEARREVPWWSEAWITEQARLLESEPGEFRRLVENEWSQGARTMFDAAAIASMVDAGYRPDASAPTGLTRLAFVDLGYSNDHAAIVTVHREPSGVVVLDDVWHYVPSKEQPLQFSEVEKQLDRLHLRYRLTVIADQWQARQLIQRAKHRGIRCAEVTIGASYHDRIARHLMQLQQAGLLRLFPHSALVQQLRHVVLKRSSAMGRDDSSIKVRIDSGAGAGVAGKDDLVVSLAGAALEATDHRRTGVGAIAIRVRSEIETPSNAMKALRARKSARMLAELEAVHQLGPIHPNPILEE